MSRDATILREILARECETVNHYQALAATAESASVRELVLHLASEEKEHIAECARLLAHVDTEYAAMMAKPLQHAIGPLAPEEGQAPPAEIQPSPEAPPSRSPRAHPGMPGATLSSPSQLTIGSLIPR